MKTSVQGKAFIESWEKCSLTVYPDLAGRPTVGYGHLILPGEDFSEGITQAEADEMFDSDLSRFESAIHQMVTVSLLQQHFDALVSLSYNIGTGNFSSSTLLKLLNTGDFKDAADQFLRWCHSGGKVSQGLYDRRVAEQAIFLTGTYVNHS